MVWILMRFDSHWIIPSPFGLSFLSRLRYCASGDSRNLLFRSVKDCAKLSVVSPVFSMASYQRRNEFMVDAADVLAAFFDGSQGGTANCVRYAQRVGKKIVRCIGGAL